MVPGPGESGLKLFSEGRLPFMPGVNHVVHIMTCEHAGDGRVVVTGLGL